MEDNKNPPDLLRPRTTARAGLSGVGGIGRAPDQLNVPHTKLRKGGDKRRQRVVQSPAKSQPPNPVQLSDADWIKLHADTMAENYRRELAGQDSFDKSILTLSSGGLAVSIGFLKDFVPIAQSSFGWSLYTSWIVFGVATAATMLSFIASGVQLRRARPLIDRYYLNRDETAFVEATRANRWTGALNWISGGSFVGGLVLTIFFISINLEKGSAMKPTAPQAPQATPLEKGLLVPNMTKVPAQNTTPSQQGPASAPAPAAPTGDQPKK